jgi:hypothetical protein
MSLPGQDVNLAVERRLQGGVDPAFRDTLQVAATKRHVDDIEPVVTGHSLNLAAQAEPGQHTVGVVVGSPADVGEDSGDRDGTESLGAQLYCRLFDGVGVVAGDQQLHFAAANRHRREVALQHVGAGRLGEFQERAHALV